MSKARSSHYEQTLPWDDQGSRLLTVANYEQYMELLDGLRERMVRERARFIEDYEDNIDQARLDLGKLFRIEDYPSKEALLGKFGIRYCQRRRKNVPARRRKNVPGSRWQLVPVVHGKAPRAGRRALRAAGGGPRVGGACGPTGSSGGLFGRVLAS